MRFFSILSALACLTAAGSKALGQSDDIQSHVQISAVTYDDGFGAVLKEPAGIWYQKSTGEVYVADAGNGRIVIFDSLLSAIFSFKHFVKDVSSGELVVGQPRGIVVNRDDEMLLLDGRSEKLELLDFRGRPITNVAPSELLNKPASRSVNLAATIDENNNFYVIIGGDEVKILVLDHDLKILRMFGEQGELPEQLNTPAAIGVSAGRVYIGDLRGVPAIKVYDSLGNFQYGFASHDIQPEDLSLPSGVAFLNGPLTGPTFIVADALRHTVKLFQLDGKFMTAIGSFGYQPGLLQFPSGVSSNDVATFYVVERSAGRVQKYDLK